MVQKMFLNLRSSMTNARKASQGPAEIRCAAGYINLCCARTPVSAHSGWVFLTCISSLLHSRKSGGEWRYFMPRQVCTNAGVAKPLASNICVLMQMDTIQIDTECTWLLFETVIT